MLEVIIIGAGQAGLALGYYLAQQGRTFIIMEAAAEIGAVWRSRYDSLLLFSPAWYTHLPGLPFPAPPNHYPTKNETADYLAHYVATFNLPVTLNSPVRAVTPTKGGFTVTTDTTTYTAAQVVIATGAFQRPFIPPLAADVDPAVFQVHSANYRNPAQLPPGPVLIVGAGNSGAQIAAELVQSRAVFLSMDKKPLSLPLAFWGKDIFWWLVTLQVARVPIPPSRRREPVIGTNIDALVREQGLHLRPRTVAAQGHTVTFANGEHLDVNAIIWATGFRPNYSWIQAPIFDAKGYPRHKRGVTAHEGLYFLGLPWQHHWYSAALGGVGEDAVYLAAHIARHSLNAPATTSPSPPLPPVPAPPAPAADY